jgi:uncharacterized protein (DUF1800 family)
MKNSLVALVFVSLLAACGGGGGGSSTVDPPGTGGGGGSGSGSSGSGGGGSAGPTEPTAEDYQNAALVLDLGTFGARYSDIENVAEEGVDAWLEEQFSMPISLHEPIVRRYGAQYGFNNQDSPIPVGQFRRFAFFENALTAPDQLRQVTAYALTQLFVVSQTGVLGNNPLGLSNYYDTLLTHSFGNYRDLLRAVTLHPAMGFYLSHVNNAKTDQDANTFPDENYAREVMQLFTIGLYELNPDGTQKLDADGRPIPTYDNTDIREFSKIFTGLAYAGDAGVEPRFGRNRAVLHTPMVMFDNYHEQGEKYLLNGFVVPAGQTGLQDIDDAVDNLFNHPNVGPFVGKQLIQRLVTSNPSPEYVTRVSSVFADNGDGIRGDLKAVIRAILTDPEVADASRVREPFRRFLAVNRALNTTPSEGSDIGVTGFFVQNATDQMVLTAPSVFNFYSPFYRPQGGQGLVAPEMQITTEDTVVGVTNLMAQMLYGDRPMHNHRELPEMRLDLTSMENLAGDKEALLLRIERLFFAGTMSEHTRSVIAGAFDEAANYSPTDRVKLVLYLALSAPDQAVAERNTL